MSTASRGSHHIPAGADATALGDLAIVIQDLSRALAGLDLGHVPGLVTLTPVESMVMNQIDAHPGITPGEIATGVNLKSSNAAAALRSLESHGFFTRTHDASDRRVVHLHPTAAAQENLAKVRSAWAQALAPVLSPDTNPELLLRQLTSIMEGLRPHG
jgi:DNA-binding MarR family transcriptional regulator